jgi:ABC-type dipeptide/oligopeptide/nickel transport system permease subunit
MKAFSPALESENRATVDLKVDRTRQHRVLRRLARNRGAVLGAIVLLLLIGLTLSASVLTSHDPLEMAPRDRLLPPSPAHWFGTDNFGRDIFARVLYGTRISLPMGLISVALALSIGLVGGLLSG